MGQLKFHLKLGHWRMWIYLHLKLVLLCSYIQRCCTFSLYWKQCSNYMSCIFWWLCKIAVKNEMPRIRYYPNCLFLFVVFFVLWWGGCHQMLVWIIGFFPSYLTTYSKVYQEVLIIFMLNNFCCGIWHFIIIESRQAQGPAGRDAVTSLGLLYLKGAQWEGSGLCRMASQILVLVICEIAYLINSLVQWRQLFSYLCGIFLAYLYDVYTTSFMHHMSLMLVCPISAIFFFGQKVGCFL